MKNYDRAKTSVSLRNVSSNADRAIIDVKKIVDYVLSFEHFEGKNKPRVFASVFGFTKLNAEDLIKATREAIVKTEAVMQSASAYGTKYTVDFEFQSIIKQVQ